MILFWVVADAFLWRDKKVSVAFVGGATIVWAFFELLEYHLLPILCYALIVVVALLFLWSNAHIFIYKYVSIPKISHFYQVQ